MDDNTLFLTIQEASEYVGVSRQTLRRWDDSGKLKPVRHPASSYRYYKRSDLEPFRLEYRRAQMLTETDVHLFERAVANIEENPRLRDPQREAHRAAREHFRNSGDAVILQIPVGCGKTGVMATLPFGVAKGRTLVITPNVTLRTNVYDALDIANQKCFWKKTGVLAGFDEGPYCAVLDGVDANLHDCNESHFVVTNIQQLASSADRWLPQFPPNYFDMILVDEGHHNVANSWLKVFEKFPNAKVVSLTATPFRADQRPLAGEVIYRYSFARAMVKGYIKQIQSVNVAPGEIYFTFLGETRRHTLDEVLTLREEQWFRRGVALAPECNRHIVEASIQWCNSLRGKTGVQHQVIAVACSVDHARQVRELYRQCGYRAAEIYSEMEPEEQEVVLSNLRLGQLDCIVQVQMLGEGFDHPKLSVGAIFRPFRSLSPYIQFVGRVMRVLHEGQPGHPDNQGIVVSHVGLNNDERWDDFREVDLEDQKIFHEWLTAEPETWEGNGTGAPRRFDVGMQVQDEIISHFMQQAFLDAEDDRVLDKLLAQPLGGSGLKVSDLVDRAALRQKLREQQRQLEAKPEPIPVDPQRRRRYVRKRLADRTGSVVSRILKDLNVSQLGREVGEAVPAVAGQDNRSATTELLNRRINEFLGIESGQRGKTTADQMEAAYAKLDDLGDQVLDAIEEQRRKEKHAKDTRDLGPRRR